MKYLRYSFLIFFIMSLKVNSFTLTEFANGENKDWDTVRTPVGADYVFDEIKISDDGNIITKYYYSLTNGYKEYFKKQVCQNSNGKIKCNHTEDYKVINPFNLSTTKEKWPCLKNINLSDFFDLDVNYSIVVKGIGKHSITLLLLNKKECSLVDISKASLNPPVKYGSDTSITNFKYIGFYNGIALFLFEIGHSPNWINLGQYDIYQNFKGIAQTAKLINGSISVNVNEQYITLSKSGLLGTSAQIGSNGAKKIDYCFLKQNEKTYLYEKIGCFPTIPILGETEIYSVGISDNNKYLVMEWINGNMTSTVVSIFNVKYD